MAPDTSTVSTSTPSPLLSISPFTSIQQELHHIEEQCNRICTLDYINKLRNHVPSLGEIRFTLAPVSLINKDIQSVQQHQMNVQHPTSSYTYIDLTADYPLADTSILQ